MAFALGFVSRLVSPDHGLRCLAVVRVGGREVDEGEEARSRPTEQNVHLGARLSPVHGARTYVFAPFSRNVGRVEGCAGGDEQAGVFEAAQHRLVEPTPDFGSHPYQTCRRPHSVAPDADGGSRPL